MSSDAKAGRMRQNAGLAVRRKCAGPARLDAVLATGPRCAVYNAMADNRRALEDYRRILAAGIPSAALRVLAISVAGDPDQRSSSFANAAQEIQIQYVNGIDPGFANDTLPASVGRTCGEAVRCMRSSTAYHGSAVIK